MANSLLGIVIALLVAWALPDLVRLRDWSWLHRLAQRWRDLRGATLPLLVAALFIACLVLVRLFGSGVAGFLFATVVLYLCLGPRDLEADVRAVLKEPGGGQDVAVDVLRGDSCVTADDDWAVLAFKAALSRWFGVIFWFIVLGAPGALAYRVVQLLARDDAFTDVAKTQRDDVEHVARVLDWLPARLLALSAALLSSLERVMGRWRAHLISQDLQWWSLDDGFLAVVATAVAGEGDLTSAAQLQRALQLLRRVLISWVALLAVVVIIT